jgi:ribose 5-phosphate isomerase A
LSQQDNLKRAAAVKALDYVTDGMKLGLGTGSTADAFIDALGGRLRAGLKVRCAATSERTAARARALGLTIEDPGDLMPLDLAIDGADEANRDLNLIKGGGGALLREKIVAASSRRMIVVGDESKLVARLGKFPLPVEVLGFGHGATAARIKALLASLGYKDAPVTLRLRGGALAHSDNGNPIYDCALGAITDAPRLAAALSAGPGVLEHGLFIGLAHVLLIARPDGVEVIERQS